MARIPAYRVRIETLTVDPAADKAHGKLFVPASSLSCEGFLQSIAVQLGLGGHMINAFEKQVET